MWKQVIRNDKKKRMEKKKEKTQKKRKRTMYRRKYKLLLPGSCTQKKGFLEISLTW